MGKVLLVNDSKFESIVIKDILNCIGYEVKVSDEYDVLNQVRCFNPKYVILNFIMKEIRGDQLASLIKLENSNIICILSSNNPENFKNIINRKKIDAVFQTPANDKILKELFENIKKNNLPNDIQTENIQNYCKNCNKKIDDLNKIKISFCPFCGYKFI